MKKSINFLTVLCILFMGINTLNAQTVYTGSQSTLREVNNMPTGLHTEKIEYGDSTTSMSVCHDTVVSQFIISNKDGITFRLYCANIITTDFYIFNNIIYLCGQESSIKKGFIAKVPFDIFFHPTPYSSYTFDILIFPTVKTINKIDVYDDNNLALIADSTYFIDYNMSSTNYTVYEYDYSFASERYKLHDVIHTNNYVCILATLYDREIFFMRHDITNIPNFEGQGYAVHNNVSNTGYRITPTINDSVAFGYTNYVDNINIWGVVGLNNFQLMYTAFKQNNPSSLLLKDLRFVSGTNQLMFLSSDMSSSSEVYQTSAFFPTGTPYSIIPQNSYSAFNSIAMQNNSRYTLLGENSSNGILLFDKTLGTSGNCFTVNPITISSDNFLYKHTKVDEYKVNRYQINIIPGTINIPSVSMDFLCQ